MAEFVVKVADERGRLLQQVEQGYSVAEVRDRFASQGYLVYWVKPQGIFSGGFSLRRRRKLKQGNFLVFNQQFLTLIKAGLPISELAGPPDQTAERQPVTADSGECKGAGKGW